jgi:hypothetical protein
MLRPSQSLLASSRGARRRAFWRDVARGLGHVLRRLALATVELVASLWDLALLCGAPVAYLAASYLAVDLPARFLFGPARFSWTGLGIFVSSVGLSYIGISRALRNAPPFAPVRPAFARAMLAVSWAAALILTLADISG